MNLDAILKRRHSVRAYDRRPIAEDNLTVICEAARLAPSACNSQTWRFVVVRDQTLIERICDEAMMPVIRNNWMREAPVIIVGCSRLDMIANRIGTGITGIEYYQIDLGIAMEHMVLKATQLGIGSCWVGWFREKKIKQILGIPKGVRVSALLALGYAKDAEASTWHSRKPLGEIVFRERWGEPWGSLDGDVQKGDA